MTRKSWVQDPVTLKLIPKDEYYANRARESGPFVIGEIEPYQSMIDGSMITGRRQHREHLRQHGCIEVGNEKLTPKAPTPPRRDDVRRDLYRVANGMGL